MQKYQFLKLEIKSVSRATIDELYKRWQSRIILTVTICLSIGIGIWSNWNNLMMVFAPSLIVIFYASFVQGQIRTLFWRQFAELNGWKYEDYGDPEQESGIMFRQGHSRHISYCVEGTVDERHFRIFSYNFTIGSGQNKEGYYYTVFAFKFNGSFPHIYLNNRNNSYNIKIGETIPLSGEFERTFSLSSPKKYEIESLEIFTPELLVNLLDNNFSHDVELVNQEVLIFTEGQINNFEKLEKEFNRALQLEDLFDEKLDKFKFQPIGDMPHSL